MRNKILFLIVFLSGIMTASAALAEEPVPSLLGVGGLIMTSPYHGVGTTVSPIPLVAWGFKSFYIRGIEAGYTFYDHNHLKLSAITSPRWMGYSSEDSIALNGMEDRRKSLDAGLRAEMEVPFVNGLSLNAKILSDVLSRNDGREGELALEQFTKSKYFRLRLSGGVKAQSSQLTGYYYGVQSGEVRADRPAYMPGHAVNPFMGVMLVTGLSEKWLITTRVGVDFLDTAIRKSPIVEDSYTLTAMVGMARRF